MIKLITVDAGHTLGVCTGPCTTDILAGLSQLPRELVADAERRLLHRGYLAEERIAELCTVLHIDPERWPRPWPRVGFEVYDYTRAALCDLAAIARVVVLSNMDSASGPELVRLVDEQCDPYLDDIWTSYSLWRRKPDPELWRHLAKVYNTDPAAIVHIGDNWANDVHVAIQAGCHAVYVETREPAPDVREWPRGAGRIAVAENLRAAVENVVALHESDG